MNIRALARGLGDPWILTTLAVSLAVIAPLLHVLAGFGTSGPAWEHVASTVLGQYVFNTAVLAISVAALSATLAIPTAWLVSLFNFPCRRVFEWALVLPLAIPTYVAAFVYIQVPEACIPLLVWVRQTAGIDTYQLAESGLRHGLLALLMAATLYPYLYITARACFARQNRIVIEAAQTLGRSPGQVFASIGLPLARPAIAAGLSLIVMEVINDYGAVHFFGVPTLTEGIFRTWFGLGDRVSALSLASLAMAAVLTLVVVERFQRGRARFAHQSGDSTPVSRRPLSRIRAATAILVCAVPLTIGFLLPVAQLIYWSWQAIPIWGEHAVREPQILNSLFLSIGAAAGITLAAVVVVYTVRLHGHSYIRGAARVAAIGYAAPGAVVAVGVMVLLGKVDRMLEQVSTTTDLPTVLLSGSLFAIGFAYLVRFLAVPLQAVRSGMTNVCGSLDEASRVLGHPPLSTLWRINLPLLKHTLLGAAVLVYIDILKELPLTMLLRPANFNTLAVTAFGLAKEGRIYESALPSLMIVLVGTIGLVALNRLIGERTG